MAAGGMSARIVRMTAPLGKAILEKGAFCRPETDLLIKSEPAAAPKKRTASRRVNGLARKPCNSIMILLGSRPAAYNQRQQNQQVRMRSRRSPDHRITRFLQPLWV